ncbi:hypothetical protein GCM10009733_040390 [Nonomuraea maheshkhaliensis]|uniref:Uncharacterized protein n=1 Tax=Nonomuraea maheshkhaliensis TaxID=419590 RepID=A0ABN2FD61_9ACTN
MSANFSRPAPANVIAVSRWSDASTFTVNLTPDRMTANVPESSPKHRTNRGGDKVSGVIEVIVIPANTSPALAATTQTPLGRRAKADLNASLERFARAIAFASGALVTRRSGL